MPATTPFYQMHLDGGARMVEFGGYKMPVQYALGIKKEHLHTREKAGLFDVSHMGQIKINGKNAKSALESLMPIDIIDLPLMRQRYALLTNESGGVIDDLMVINLSDDCLLLIVNAAAKKTDFTHLQTSIGCHCQVEAITDYALLALQGPKADEVLTKLAPYSGSMAFMSAQLLMVAGIECLVTRSGYSGEDGFEIRVANDSAEQLATCLLADQHVEWIGLGARDSLRLEAGFSLYGNELDSKHTPLESSLTWILSKSRKAAGARAAGYLGAEVIMRQLKHGVKAKIVGLIVAGRIPVRSGTLLMDGNANEVGLVTSGGFSPSLNKSVVMARVSISYAEPGCQLFALVRGRKISLEVVKLPFVKHHYFRG